MLLLTDYVNEYDISSHLYWNRYCSLIKYFVDRNMTYVKMSGMECHHILPKSLGGNNTKANMVVLYAREHFILHNILCKASPTKQNILAFHNMCNVRNNSLFVRSYRVTSRHFDDARRLASEAMSGSGNPRFGKPGISGSQHILFNQKPWLVAKTVSRPLSLHTWYYADILYDIWLTDKPKPKGLFKIITNTSCDDCSALENIVYKYFIGGWEPNGDPDWHKWKSTFSNGMTFEEYRYQLAYKYTVVRDDTISLKSKAVIGFNKNIPRAKRLQEIFEVWSTNGKPSYTTLSKSFNSFKVSAEVVEKFRGGWIPNLCPYWLEWMDKNEFT